MLAAKLALAVLLAQSPLSGERIALVLAQADGPTLVEYTTVGEAQREFDAGPADVRRFVALWSALSTFYGNQVLREICTDTRARCETKRGVRPPLNGKQ